MAETPIFKWLRDGSTVEANVDGSVTPATYSYACPADETIELERLLVYIQDTGNFNVASYGNGITLANGLEIEAAGVDLLDGQPIKTNADWAALCYDLSYFSFGVGDNAAAVRWTFGKAGAPLILESLETIAVTVNDDMTGLTGHRFMVQGTFQPKAGR